MMEFTEDRANKKTFFYGDSRSIEKGLGLIEPVP